jgi:hypothetical protein
MELKNAREKFLQIRQSQNRPSWCIPVGFEVLRHYFGYPKPTSDEMVLEYHKRYGDEGYGEAFFENNQLRFRTVKLNNPTLEQLGNYGFPKGGFDTFKDIANALLPNDCDRVFEHPADCQDKFEFYLAEVIKNGDGILAVKKLPDGNCHVLAIIGYDDKSVTAYDPGPGNIETKTIDEFPLNRDCIIFKKRV